MTSISGLGSSLIDAYEKFKPYKSELTTENMFQMLSVEIGGDGETIDKAQLDSYIEEAEDGTIEVSKSELEALNMISDNWDTIAGKGAESITYDKMDDYTGILLTAVTGGVSVSSNTTSNSDSSDSAIDDIDAYLIESTLGLSKDDATGLNSLLTTLLSGNTDEKDDENANLISTLVNLISNYESNSTVEVEA